MSNRLASETSPYLLQHQDNPVDWYPWGDAAFSAARNRDVPILLSVGYSTCHWCHVMERESFEDPATAALINDWFVPVKVDREERPDVDAIYMEAVQAMTGHGGWPMTVFLTPEGAPIFAGTYFPNEDRHGMPSFRRVLEAVHEAWTERRQQLEGQAAQLTSAIGRRLPPAERAVTWSDLSGAYEQIAAQFDPVHGGFGRAPKFPQEPVLEFILRAVGHPWAPTARHMLEVTLTKMAAGGIYDQLGGGFARYATDAEWTVPHFEKMLYNNAWLSHLYLRGWQVTGRKDFRRIAVETIDYVLRDLATAAGGFVSAEDADSEGVEGKFYVWTPPQILSALEAAGLEGSVDLALAWYDVTDQGNYEGATVLTTRRSVAEVAAEFDLDEAEAEERLDTIRAALLAARDTRVRPGVDDKIITAWNGFMVHALAEAGAVLGRSDYLEAARRCAAFLLSEVRRGDGRLLRSWAKGRPGGLAYLEDYAALSLGLSTLYAATGELRWYSAGADLAASIPDLFMDDSGTLFATGRDAEALIVRPQDQFDNPTPSGSSLAAEVFLRQGHYRGEAHWFEHFEQLIRNAGVLIERAPSAAAYLLAVLTSSMDGVRELAVVGPDAVRLAAVAWEAYRPDVIVAVDETGSGGNEVPLLAHRFRGGETLAYVCERMVCAAPVAGADDLRRLLGQP